ncbi:MAG: hypothetical protein J6P56_07640 [Bacteroidales bacterium]|nr:hypothetical protein [Bacteroidales bacterium]
MKKIFAILSVAAVALMTVVSCEKEKEAPHQPGQPDVANCYGVFFPVQEATGYHIYDPTQDLNATFTIGRTNSQGAITVPVVVEASADNVFEIATISFADGQTETTFDVNMKNVEDGKQYDLHLEVTDPQYASLYAAKTTFMDFSFMRVEMLTLKEPDGVKDAVVTMTVNNDFLGDFGYEEPSYTVTGTVQYYEVNNVRYAELVPIEHPVWFSDATIKFNWYTKVSYTVGEKDVQPIEVPSLYTGYDLPGEEVGADVPCPVFAKDYYHYWTDRGESLGTFAEFVPKYGASYPLGYYDGNGGFFFNLIYTIEGTNYWYGYCENSVVAIASGYSRVDYSLELEADYPYDGETPIYIETGLDVENLKYAIYEGELSKIQIENKVAAIIDGSEASTEFSDFEIDEEEAVKYATLYVSPEETGLYTLVAVAFDKDKKAQNSAGTVFQYVSAEDEEEYAVDINVFAEDTPARYTTLTKYDSFAFGVYGSELTEVHLIVTETSKVTANVLYALKSDSQYAADEETLEKINSPGGYYDVISDLDDDTNYTVLVWATNGYEESYAVAQYQTEIFPEQWKGIGKGSWTDDFFTTFFNVTPQTMEVDVEQSEDDPTRFRAIYPYDDKYPYNEPGDWDDTKSYDLVVSIPDETHVYIVPQKIGVDWGYGNTTIASTAGRYIAAGYSIEEIEAAGIKFGQFKDGVVTFPEENTLLVQLPNYSSSFYYANSNGAFQFVIPGANASAPAAAPAAVSFPKPYGIDGSCLIAAPEVKHVFQRDPQPVKVSVKVNYTRKEIKNTNTKSKAVTELR